MAIFRLEAKIISRAKRGRSVIAAAAYRAGTKLKDEITKKIFNYLNKGKAVAYTAILAPEGASPWVFDSGALWNKVEAGEVRKDGRLAREFVLALPKELSAEEQIELATSWAQKELVGAGMVVELSIHHPKSGKNPHAHLLCPTRKLDGDTFSAKKPREWNDVDLLLAQRESWAQAVNAALEKAGRPERVDHRSLKDRGVDREPEPKIGVAATAMKRRGVENDPERFKLVRKVKLMNEARALMKAMQKPIGFKQYGHGAKWWDKTAGFMSHLRDKASEVVKDTWQKLLDSGRGKAETKGPHLDM